jgi:hypothetical protein
VGCIEVAEKRAALKFTAETRTCLSADRDAEDVGCIEVAEERDALKFTAETRRTWVVLRSQRSGLC